MPSSVYPNPSVEIAEAARFAPCAELPGQTCRFADKPEISFNKKPFGPQHIYRCTTCGHGLTMPPVDDLMSLYGARETQDYQGRDTALVTAVKSKAFARQARALIAQAHFAGGRIVDFGCGSGLYTDAIAASAGGESEVIGLDFFPDPPPEIGSARYLPFSQSECLSGTADLVTCSHVLEHETDTRYLLDRLMALAKPGATIVIEVPNIDCPWRHLFGQHWDNWYVPFHRHHFSRSSLRAALTGDGLSIVSEHAVHVPSIGRSVANLLGMRNTPIFVAVSALAHPLQTFVEWASNGPSAIRIVARSPR